MKKGQFKPIEKEFYSKNKIEWKPLGKFKRAKNTRQWLGLFECKCGVVKWIWLGNIRGLKSRNCNSCGGIEHGDSSRVNPKYHQLHRTWITMRSRCRNPKRKEYKNYGGRGISVCEEWNSYNKFKAWALKNGYDPKLQIDRIDNNGNYEPQNCRWVNSFIQSRNKRGNIWIGSTVLSDLAKELGVTNGPIKRRLKMGWTELEIRKSPKRKKLFGLPKYVTKRANGKFRARIGSSGKIHLGDFNSVKEAVRTINNFKNKR